MHNTYRDYPGLTGLSQIMLSNADELSFLATGKSEYMLELDNYYSTSKIVFADGTVFEVFIQEKSETGGDHFPAYLALKNDEGQVIPSSLWPEREIERNECDLPLYVKLMESKSGKQPAIVVIEG